jgi:4-amino-4-deoxy-L-arabinose transferase-like glycosyltransferase
VGLGDSAELVVASYTLGVPHATGYPVYTWVGKLFSLLPFGSIAFRLNLMSALFASLTVFLVFQMVVRELRSVSAVGGMDYLAGATAIILVGLSRPFWHCAQVAEVYTLNAFCVVLFVWLYFTWLATRKVKYVYVASLVLGLSTGTHLSNVLLVPAFLLVTFAVTRTWRIRLLCCALFLIGVSQYLYLPLRVMQSPAYVHPQAQFFQRLEWTDTDNPLYNWLWFITGGRWHGWSVRSTGELVRKAGELLRWVLEDYGIAWLAFAVIGVVLYFSNPRNRERAIILVSILLCQLVYFATYRLSLSGMILPFFCCFSILIGLGVGLAPRVIGRLVPAMRPQKWVRGTVIAIVVGLLAVSCVSRPFIDHSGDRLSSVFFFKVAGGIPAGSVLDGLKWEQKRVLDYYRLVEGYQIPFEVAECDSAAIAAGKCYILGRAETVEKYTSAGFALSLHLTVDADGSIPVFRVNPHPVDDPEGAVAYPVK